MIAYIEELEEMDASEIHARRLNAKEVLTQMKDDNFIFPVADGTGIHTSTELHVAHFRARRGGKHAVCVGTVHDRAQGRPLTQGPAACVSLLGSVTPLAVIACSRNRLTLHVREEAGRHDGKASFLSKGINKLKH